MQIFKEYLKIKSFLYIATLNNQPHILQTCFTTYSNDNKSETGI